MTHPMWKTLQAAALRYDAEADDAPRVVAMGEGHLARRIIERAKQHGVPVFEDSGLAKELMQLQLGERIPSRIYYAVAKVLAFVYALEQRQREQTRGKRREGRTFDPPPSG